MQLTISTQGQQITLSTPLATAQIEATDQRQVNWKSICQAYQDSHVGWAVFFAHNLLRIWWAEKIAHPTGLLATIAKVISDGEDIAVLERFEVW